MTVSLASNPSFLPAYRILIFVQAFIHPLLHSGCLSSEDGLTDDGNILSGQQWFQEWAGEPLLINES